MVGEETKEWEGRKKKRGESTQAGKNLSSNLFLVANPWQIALKGIVGHMRDTPSGRNCEKGTKGNGQSNGQAGRKCTLEMGQRQQWKQVHIHSYFTIKHPSHPSKKKKQH